MACGEMAGVYFHEFGFLLAYWNSVWAAWSETTADWEGARVRRFAFQGYLDVCTF